MLKNAPVSPIGTLLKVHLQFMNIPVNTCFLGAVRLITAY
jgi:hypothetical protein